MSRKIRKNIAQQPVQISKCYRAAAYLRLSVQKVNQPSESIENQLKLIQDFVSTRGDIILEKTYSDENTSGANFGRHEFQQMQMDIESGKINCVIVKDLSRLGREFVETSYYIEMYFPRHQVRFISVNDRFDTLDGMSNITFGELPQYKVPLANLMNEAFVADIRQKMQSNLDTCAQAGGYVAPRAPYGYRKNPDDCHKLLVDEEAAAIVKDIFLKATNNTGLNEIVRQLNAAKILPPIEYAKSKGLQGNYQENNGFWNTRSLKKILTNQTYTGNLLQGKKQILVENTHEAIINKDTFEFVQTIITTAAETKSNASQATTTENSLKGKVICGFCGGKMQRRRGSGNADWHFFTCITNNRLGAGNCTGMYIREAEILESILAEAVKDIARHQAALVHYEQEKAILDGNVESILQQIEEYQILRKADYENMARGKLAKAIFLIRGTMMKSLNEKLLAAQDAISDLDIERGNHQMFCDACAGNAPISELISHHLSRVVICQDKSIAVELS